MTNDPTDSLIDLSSRYARFRQRCVYYGGLEPSNTAACYEALSYLKAQPQAAAAVSLMPDALQLLDDMAAIINEGAAARKEAACNSDVHEQPSGDLVGHPPSRSEISVVDEKKLIDEIELAISESLLSHRARFGSMHTPEALAVFRTIRPYLRTAEPDDKAKESIMPTDEQIKHMVRRFLGWRLPEHFRPDCGIHFDADAAKKLHPNNLRYEPIGTNLFCADQAEQMIRYMVDGLPMSPKPVSGKLMLTGKELMAAHKRWMDAGCPSSIALEAEYVG